MKKAVEQIYKKEEGCCSHSLVKKVAEKEYTVPTTVKVTAQQIEDLIVTAIEGGITYWAGLCDSDLFKDKPKDLPISQFIFQLLYEGKSVKFYDAEEDDDSVDWELTLDKLLKGIALNYEQRKWDSDLDNYDADTADSIIQFALFGELVYG